MNTPKLNSEVTKKTDEVEKKVRKYKRRAKKHSKSVIYATLVLTAFLTSYMFMKGLIAINTWSQDNTIMTQSFIVIKLHTPLYVKHTGPTLIPKVNKVIKKVKPLSRLEMVTQSKYAKFIDHIWFRESGRGSNTTLASLNNVCKSRGMTNEFGFDPADGWCWGSFKDAVKRMEVWREKEAKGLTDNQALCFYNTGKALDDCAYLGTNFQAMN